MDYFFSLIIKVNYDIMIDNLSQIVRLCLNSAPRKGFSDEGKMVAVLKDASWSTVLSDSQRIAP